MCGVLWKYTSIRPYFLFDQQEIMISHEWIRGTKLTSKKWYNEKITFIELNIGETTQWQHHNNNKASGCDERRDLA